MMMESFAAHWFGNLVIVIVCGLCALACFGVALHMLLRPGEKDEHHPKYLILHDDR